MHCILLVILSCSSWRAAGLNAAHTTAAFADTYTTQRVFTQPNTYERNPLAVPFQTHGSPVAYSSTLAGTYAASFLADRMKHSHNRVLRRIWWLPQAGLTAAHIWAIQNNVRVYNRFAK